METGKFIFISYTTKDCEAVEEVLKILDGRGVEYWKAPEAIPPGSSYAREIPVAIKNCSMVLLFMSKNSQSSIWVEKEVDNAINNGKEIVPLLLDDSPIEDVFLFYLNNVQMIPWYSDKKAGESRMLSSVGKYFDVGAERGFAQPKHEGRVPAKKELPPVGQEPARQPVVPKRSVRFSDQVKGFMNRIPLSCEQCGGALVEQKRSGIFVCMKCGAENYDDFRIIRDFLNENGPAPMSVIVNATGIPHRIVKNYQQIGERYIRN